MMIDKDLFTLLEINDYSLLLGIHYLKANEGEALVEDADVTEKVQ